MNFGFLGSLSLFGTSATPADIPSVIKEIEGGLKNEAARMDLARVCKDYYEGRFERYQTEYPRKIGTCETAQEYVHRGIPFLRSVVNALIRRLYMDDPKRVVNGHPEVTELLNEIYSKGRLTPKLKDSLKYAALGGVAAIQVEVNPVTDDSDVAAMQSLRRPPVNFRLWSADEFAVWCSPDEPLSPFAVAVLDRYDNQTRCRLWTPQTLYTFTSKKWGGGPETAGTRIFTLQSEEPNWLGVVPFFFQWWIQPTREFWVWHPGPELMHENEQANARLSKIADDIMFTRPVTYSRNVDEKWKPPDRITPRDLVRLPGILPENIGDVPFDGPSLETTSVDLSYLEHDRAEIDAHLDMVAELHGVPKGQWRGRTNSATSGVEILSEALPVIEFCESQQVLMEDTERDGALLTLMITDAYIGESAGVRPAIENFDLALEWPPLTKNRPGKDFDAHVQMRAVNGWDSPIQSHMTLTGCTEDEAIEHFASKAEHDKLIMALSPQPAIEPMPEEDGQDRSDGGEPAEEPGTDDE